MFILEKTVLTNKRDLGKRWQEIVCITSSIVEAFCKVVTSFALLRLLTE